MAHTTKMEFTRPDGMHIGARITQKATRREVAVLLATMDVEEVEAHLPTM